LFARTGPASEKPTDAIMDDLEYARGSA